MNLFGFLRRQPAPAPAVPSMPLSNVPSLFAVCREYGVTPIVPDTGEAVGFLYPADVTAEDHAIASRRISSLTQTQPRMRADLRAHLEANQ